MKSKPNEDEAAFTLNDGDRFHSLIVSDGIRYEVEPDHETVITFFVVRRSSGLCDIYQVLKTFKGDTCISRNVQSKLNIVEGQIDSEIAAIKVHFTEGIRQASGIVLKWNNLALKDVPDQQEQIRRIRACGRVGVRVGSEIPPISLN